MNSSDERLEAKSYSCSTCGVVFKRPYAQLNSGIAVLSDKSGSYGDGYFVSTKHVRDIFDTSEAHAEMFMKEAYLLAGDLRKMLGVPNLTISFDQVGGNHLVARLNQRDRAYASEEEKAKLHSDLLKHYSSHQYLKLSESFLRRIKSYEDETPVESKVIFMNYSNPELAEKLTVHLRQQLNTLDHARIVEYSGPILGSVALKEIETGIYSLQFSSGPHITRPKSIRKELTKRGTIQRGASMDIFYKNEFFSRTVSLKRHDEEGFLAFTPLGYRRFLWSRIRGIYGPFSTSVTREVIRLNRYEDGTIKVLRENLYRTRTVGAGS